MGRDTGSQHGVRLKSARHLGCRGPKRTLVGFGRGFPGVWKPRCCERHGFIGTNNEALGIQTARNIADADGICVSDGEFMWQHTSERNRWPDVSTIGPIKAWLPRRLSKATVFTAFPIARNSRASTDIKGSPNGNDGPFKERKIYRTERRRHHLESTYVWEEARVASA